MWKQHLSLLSPASCLSPSSDPLEKLLRSGAEGENWMFWLKDLEWHSKRLWVERENENASLQNQL